VILRLSRFPAWKITVNGKPATAIATRQDGLIALPVPAGPSTVEIRWVATPDVLWGRWISIASLLALIAVWTVERRLKAIRLSSNQCLLN
jgi:hypothetical protein